jgi:hypothetical protein
MSVSHEFYGIKLHPSPSSRAVYFNPQDVSSESVILQTKYISLEHEPIYITGAQTKYSITVAQTKYISQ